LKVLIALILNALALIITAYIVPGIHVSGFTMALLAAIILGLINTFIKPILLFLTAPLNFLTLGLFTFVVNAVVLYLVALILPAGFQVDSFGWAILGAVVLSLVSTVLSMLLKDVETEVATTNRRSKRSKKR
jgi:putative membrane protein